MLRVIPHKILTIFDRVSAIPTANRPFRHLAHHIQRDLIYLASNFIDSPLKDIRLLNLSLEHFEVGGLVRLKWGGFLGFGLFSALLFEEFLEFGDFEPEFADGPFLFVDGGNKFWI